MSFVAQDAFDEEPMISDDDQDAYLREWVSDEAEALIICGQTAFETIIEEQREKAIKRLESDEV